MNKLVTSSTAIALFLLAGCAASGPKLASSAEDIVGTWQSTTDSVPGLQFNEDGTAFGDPASVSPRPGEFRFEGTRLFLVNIAPGDDCVLLGAETGIYEVELLENGNLKFTAIEDECAVRVTGITGALIEKEWEPVP